MIFIVSWCCVLGRKLSCLWCYTIRLCEHGVVSERFHSELFRKTSDFSTYFEENQHKLRLFYVRARTCKKRITGKQP